MDSSSDEEESQLCLDQTDGWNPNLKILKKGKYVLPVCFKNVLSSTCFIICKKAKCPRNIFTQL